MIEQPEGVREAGTSVELFAGGGGLAMAVHAAGFRHLLLNEYAPKACETLLANMAVPWREETRIPQEYNEPWPLKGGPVQDVDFSYLHGQVTLLAGGPPCQPFSLGGEHKGHEDERNMFPEFFKALRQTQPKAFICENVRGLLRQSFLPYFNYIINELRMPFIERTETDWEEHGQRLEQVWQAEPVGEEERHRRYVVFPMPVNAADYGVPQIRHRVIIVGFRMDLGIDREVWEKFMPRRTHSEAALYAQLAATKSAYWQRHGSVPPEVRKRIAAAVPLVNKNDKGLMLLPWRTLRDAIAGDSDRGERPLPQTGLIDYHEHPDSPAPNHIGWPGARIYPGHTPNLLDRPAKTVKAGVHGVPGGESVMLLDDGGHRYMTVRETARVMTFPDTWTPGESVRRGDQMRQLGNAVPVLLGQRFAEAVADAILSVSTLDSGTVSDSDAPAEERVA
jgi:DNA (cytosine-5)-methyltransferase 1